MINQIFLFLGADEAGGGVGRRSEMGEDACVVPFRSQNQRPGTFYDASNFSGLLKTQLVRFRVFFARSPSPVFAQ